MALLRVNTPPPPFAMPTTPRSMRKLPRTPATPPMTATNLWTESVWNDDEFRNRDAERPAAIDQIMRRSTATATTTTACTRRGERAADIDTAIQWIRSELTLMREQDRKLLKQFTAISNAIRHLKNAQDDLRLDEEATSSGSDVDEIAKLSTDSASPSPQPVTNASRSAPVLLRRAAPRRRPDRVLPATPSANKKRSLSVLIDEDVVGRNESRFSWC